MMDTKGITASKSEDISEWYEQVCLKSNIVDFGAVKGTMVIKPKGYYIWEQIQKEFQKTIDDLGAENAYFPLFIPESFFKKEAEHAKGFAPELAWVATNNSGKEEKAIIRPSSEAIITDQFRKWLRNYKELPIKVNQWCNVVRWEVKQTKLFLRSREFLWQEGHCIYETEEDCMKDVLSVLRSYQRLAKELLALPTIAGEKTEAERFPGAKTSYTFETMMPDGKALQSGTSHNLGQGFPKAFGVSYMGRDGKPHTPYANSWGISTRLIGATIMTHSDIKGLILPPRIVKHKVVIVPVCKKKMDPPLQKVVDELVTKLEAYGAIVDEKDCSMGWKLSESELQGTPIVLILGQRELDEGLVTVKVRDSEKKQVKLEDLNIEKELNDFHDRLYAKADKFLQEHIVDVNTVEGLVDAVQKGNFAKAHFCCDKDVEEKFEEEII